MNVKDVVNRVVEKYKTRNPYELADLMDIYVIKHELGKIKGYFLEIYGVKQIILNSSLNYHDEMLVLAHEIGHVVMHKANVSFWAKNTFLSEDKLELEANKFAVELLIPDNFLEENHEYTTSQISKILGYPEDLIQLRLK